MFRSAAIDDLYRRQSFFLHVAVLFSKQKNNKKQKLKTDRERRKLN